MDPPSQPQASKRIYLGNLPYTATSTDISAYLSDAGFEVARIDMTVDPLSGRNPSYCFAELLSVEEAQRALQALPGASFMGRPLKVNVHTPRRAGASGGMGGAGFGGERSPRTGGMGMGGFERGGRSGGFAQRDGEQTQQRTGYTSRYSAERRDESSASATESTRLYVGGLPLIDSPTDNFSDDIKAVFKDYQVTSVSKLIAPHESKVGTPGNHYYCFVDLASVEEAQAAAGQLDGVESPWGGSLKVNAAKARVGERRTGMGGRGEGQGEKPAVARDFNNWRRG